MVGDTGRAETRRVGSGGHEEGVGGVDEGVENASPPLWKRVRITRSECAAFSAFPGVASDVVNENKKLPCNSTTRSLMTRTL